MLCRLYYGQTLSTLFSSFTLLSFDTTRERRAGSGWAMNGCHLGSSPKLVINGVDRLVMMVGDLLISPTTDVLYFFICAAKCSKVKMILDQSRMPSRCVWLKGHWSNFSPYSLHVCAWVHFVIIFLFFSNIKKCTHSPPYVKAHMHFHWPHPLILPQESPVRRFHIWQGESGRRFIFSMEPQEMVLNSINLWGPPTK